MQIKSVLEKIPTSTKGETYFLGAHSVNKIQLVSSY